MKSAIEIIKCCNIVVFCALTIACAAQWIKRPSAGIRWATAAFGVLAGLSLIGLALQQPATQGLTMWLIKALLVTLILFPYFLYRFATSFQKPKRWFAVPAHVSTAVVVVWSFLIPSVPASGAPHPSWWSYYRIGVLSQWTILFAIVAAVVWGAGRRESTIARIRMRVLAIATAGMNGCVLLSGVAKVPQSPSIIVVTQSVFFVSSILFFIGLAPPSWLVRMWRRPEEAAMQTAMRDLFRAEGRHELAAVLLPRAAGFVGARGAALVMHDGELLGSYGTTDDPEMIFKIASTSPGAAIPAIHRIAMRAGTLMIWTSPYAPFFGREELALSESLGVFADIVMERCVLAEERKKGEEALVFQSLHDGLTGLPNRVLFLDRLAQAQSGLSRPGGALGVLFLDLDRFKLVNDSLDHIAGDELLESVARRLSGSVRDGDTVARFGGDEFVILAEVRDEREALELGDRLTGALGAPFVVAGRKLTVTASVGVVVTRDHEDPVLLLRNADVAMYRAKELGRAQVVLFDEDMRVNAVGRLGMERELRQAIEERSLELYYQPVIRLTDRAVVGVEALLRWKHPRRGLLLPNDFVPVAEESNLIVDLGSFALTEACRQARIWRDTLPGLNEFSVWVNVAAAQFSRTDMVAAVRRALEDNRLEPESLGLEITESAFIGHTDALRTALVELRLLGVRIAIDDFGTGASSLGRLKDLPADVVKIDGSFVRGLGQTRGNSAIVAACVSLADAFGLTVVAESIENSRQLTELLDEHCVYGQGHYFSPALREAEATKYLRRHTAVNGLPDNAAFAH